MSRIEEMRHFVRVVEAGSISAAAEQLGLAKSGVSRRLSQLEKRLGTRLLNRTTRRSSLTDAGRSYYEGAVKLLSELEELDAQVSGDECALEGRLKLAAPLSFGLSHLTPAIDEFARLHPGVRVEIDFSDRLVDLVAQGIDLAIRIAELRDSSLRARRICPIRLMLCASPAYLERYGMPVTPDDLREHRVLHYDIGGGPLLRLGDGRGGDRVMPVKPRMLANNGDFLRDMAIAGHGIVVTPTFIAWQALALGELVPILEPYWPSEISAYAVYPHSRFLPRRARVLIDFLAERFGDNPYWDQVGFSPAGTVVCRDHLSGSRE